VLGSWRSEALRRVVVIDSEVDRRRNEAARAATMSAVPLGAVRLGLRLTGP